MSKPEYVFGIVGAGDSQALLVGVGEEIHKLSEKHGNVELVSLSHCIEQHPSVPTWTACIACRIIPDQDAAPTDEEAQNIDG